jgi:hypothetical protein
MWRRVVWFQRKSAASVTQEETVCSTIMIHNDGCSRFIRNVDPLTPENTVSYPRSSDLQISHRQPLNSHVKAFIKKNIYIVIYRA